MSATKQTYCFDQLHIDVARNTTDDFNPFHDPRRWHEIKGNPFGSTIALGFQTEFLASHLVEQHRLGNGESDLAARHGLHFSNYEFLFAGALRPSEKFTVSVRKTVDKTGQGGGISNRVLVRNTGRGLVLLGTQSETREPRFRSAIEFEGLPEQPTALPDRAVVEGSSWFLKRKFLSTSNGKNFALASLAEQHTYFDELAERVKFPPVFTAALISCALLEQGLQLGYDFTADPMVYTSHQLSVDRRLQSRLASNDSVHLLVNGPVPTPPTKGLGNVTVEQQLYACLGVLSDGSILFCANVQMAPLHSLSGL